MSAGVRTASVISRPVLVTGASRGLGLTTALQLAEQGFEVWAGYRDAGAVERLAEAARARGVSLRPVSLDVTDGPSIDRAVDALVAASGPPVALVNNAGVTLRGYFEDLTEEETRRIFEVNCFGAMNVSKRVLPLMRAAGGGRIVMMSSVAGRIGSAALAPYVATKFALEGFAESLSLEVAPFNIKVVIVEPGIVATEIWDTDRTLASKALDVNGPYYRWFMRLEKEVEALVRTSTLTPERVGAVVLEAITAPRPRLRYVVGRRASLLVTLRRHLPGELFERFYFGEVLRRITGGAVS
jgi:NAD(P)-dependent dehydrogenase (short-subunit alcohol dehydrogenase family)